MRVYIVPFLMVPIINDWLCKLTENVTISFLTDELQLAVWELHRMGIGKDGSDDLE